MGGSKGKAGTTEMYPMKVIHIIGGYAFDPNVLLFQPTM